MSRTRRPDSIELKLRVQAGAKRDEIVGMHGPRVKVRISAVPVGGKANRNLMAFLAREFGVPRGNVKLVAGEYARDKLVTVAAPVRLPDWYRSLADAASA